MQTLRVGSKGPFVQQWETFLRGLDLLNEREVDTEYTGVTAVATRRFQERYGLGSDGIAGNQTIGYAMAQLGFEVLPLSEDVPEKPKDAKQLNFASRQRLLGKIEYRAAGTASNPEAVKITNNWQQENLGSVVIPQLKGVVGAPTTGKVFFHKKGCDQLKAMFQAWEDKGLIDRVETWGGSWNPRFIRGSRSVLSNHAHASAIDLNAAWNGLNRRPALIGERGSVRELVTTAYEHGFYWGNWFSGRKDGMHFELCKLL